MIKVIFFDVGGTLIHPHPSVGAIYSRVAERHGLVIPAELLNLRFKEIWKKNKGQRSTVDKEWWHQMVVEVFKGQPFNDPHAFFEDLYAEFEKKEVWHLYPDVEPTLSELKSRGIRLAVISNWDSRLPALLLNLHLDTFFEKQFISFDLKITKPDARFFQHALQKMHVEPLEALHIGDDLEEDIEGAQRVGMRAYHIDRLHKPKNSRTLSTLSDILLRL